MKENNNGNGLLGFLGLLGAGIGLYYWNENRKNKQVIVNQYDIMYEQDARYKQLADAYVRLQQQFNEFRQQLLALSSQDNLKIGVKKQLTELIQKYQVFDEDVTKELLKAMSFVDTQHGDQAAFSLAKIIEQQLILIVKRDVNFKDKKSPTFHDCLDYAKNKQILNTEEHQYAKGLKESRNKDAHEINVKRKDNFTFAALMTGIGLISKIFEYRSLFNI